jgi:cell division protein FtsW (lipid II flippase)
VSITTLTPYRLLARARRRSEIGLGLHVLLFVAGGYVLLALADGPSIPPDLPAIAGFTAALYIVVHLAIRRLAPAADPTLIPLVAVLNGIGFITITRIDVARDTNLARLQSTWVLVGVAVFVAVLLLVPEIGALARARYTLGFAGVAFLLLPLVPPPVGRTINGARIWAKVGPISFQPGEVAKVLLVAFFAGYLVDKKELLSGAGRQLGRIQHLGPLLTVWGISILVMVAEKDLGSSLLLFTVFATMLYMATGRALYLFGGFSLFATGAIIAFRTFDHVQTRVDIWLDPWTDAQGKGYQIIQSWYAFAAGRLGGTGLGLGAPDKVPLAETDFIVSAIGEELGLLGTIALVATLMLLVGSGFRIAVDSRREFNQLFCAGLAVILGMQSFIIIGGATRLIPMTGITLPFVSYGGSSLVANFAIVALLARASDEAARRRLQP